MNQIYSPALEIANAHLFFIKPAEELSLILSKRYEKFLVCEKSSSFYNKSYNIFTSFEKRTAKIIKKPSVQIEKKRVFFSGPFFEAEMRGKNCHLSFALSPSRNSFNSEFALSLDSFLRVFLSYHTQKNNMLLLHSAGVSKNCKAILVAGKESSGKSTLISLLPEDGTLVLSDEIVGAGFRKAAGTRTNLPEAFPTPFMGERAGYGRGDIHELSCIFILEGKGENRVRYMKKEEGLKCLMRNLINFSRSTTPVRQILQTSLEILDRVPVLGLSFKKSQEVWGWLFSVSEEARKKFSFEKRPCPEETQQ